METDSCCGPRTPQDYLFRKAEKHAIPCVENTNIDRSVGLIHLTLLGWVRVAYSRRRVRADGSYGCKSGW